MVNFRQKDNQFKLYKLNIWEFYVILDKFE